MELKNDPGNNVTSEEHFDPRTCLYLPLLLPIASPTIT